MQEVCVSTWWWATPSASVSPYMSWRRGSRTCDSGAQEMLEGVWLFPVEVPGRLGRQTGGARAWGEHVGSGADLWGQIPAPSFTAHPFAQSI